MANEQNLKPIRTESEAREKGRNGGIASGQARREAKATRKILQEIVNLQAKDNQLFAKIAPKMGLQGDESIHKVFTMACLLNTVKKGDLADLDRLQKLLGEDKDNENADVLDKLDKVIGEVDKLAE